MEFLETKDVRPPVRGLIVESPRRSQALGVSLERPLTLVFAPPGYGKTTLCSSFCAELPAGKYKAIWLNLDESDANSNAFLFDLVCAVDRALPDLGAGKLLEDQFDDGADRANDLEFLVSFANILSRSKKHVYIVLDNYDVVSHDAGRAMRFLAHSVAQNVSMVILTNKPMGFEFADLRLSGDLVELGPRDLLLTREEAEFFLEENCEVRLDDAQLREIYELSGGCVSILRVVANCMSDMSSGRLDYDAALSEARSKISDYRLSILLRMFDEAVLRHLMKLSFAPKFTSGLRKTLGLEEFGRETIEALKACGAVVEAKSEFGSWFSISPEYVETMREMRELYLTKDECDEVCNALIDWYEDEEMFEEALELMIVQKNDGRFISLFTRNMEALLQRNDGSRILGWLGGMTEAAATSNLATLLASAWGSFTAGLPEETLRWLRYIFAAYNYEHIATREEDPDYYDLWSIIKTAEACATSQMGRYTEGIELTQRAIERLGGANVVLADRTNLWLWVTLWHNLGESYMQVGEPKKAYEALATCRMDSIIARRPTLYHFSSFEMGMMRLNSGNIRGAERLFKETIKAGKMSVPVSPTWALGLVHLGMAHVKILEGDIPAARENYLVGREIVRQSANVDGYLDCLVIRTHLEFMEGNLNQASSIIRDAYNEATVSRVPRGVGEDVMLLKLHIDAEAGDYLSAQKVMAECAEAIAEDDLIHRMLFCATSAYYHALLKDPDAALPLLDEALELAHRLDSLFNETLFTVLRSGVLWDLGRREEAGDDIVKALFKAFGMGTSVLWRAYASLPSTRIVLDKFLHSSDVVFSGLRREHALLVPFAMECMETLSIGASPAAENDAFAGTLTPKERSVCEMVIAGKTRKEIAEVLGVSENTVKTHVRAVYRKLGVHSNKELREKGLPDGSAPCAS